MKYKKAVENGIWYILALLADKDKTIPYWANDPRSPHTSKFPRCPRMKAPRISLDLRRKDPRNSQASRTIVNSRRNGLGSSLTSRSLLVILK